MAYRVEDTDEFRIDYSAIITYLIEILGSPAAANNLFLEMEKMRSILASTPEIRAVSKKPALEEKSYREYLVKNYIVVYRIENNTVILVRMFHGSQNYEAYV